MVSIEIGSSFPPSWIYVEGLQKIDGIIQTAALIGEQWDAGGEPGEEPASCGNATIYIYKNVDEEGAQDLLLLVLNDDEPLAFVGGEANVTLIIDDDLKILTKVLSEVSASQPVFLMSKQLIALLTVAKKIVFVYMMGDGSQRFAAFNAAASLRWNLESD